MPSLQNYRVSIPLTQYSLGYTNADFIGEQIFPILSRQSRFGSYYAFGREIFTPEVDRRAPGTRANEVEHTFTQVPYTAEEHALIEPVTWEERDEAQKNGFPGDPYRDATDIVTQKIALGREIEIANMLRSTANLTSNTTLAGTAQWSDQTTLLAGQAQPYTVSDPVANVMAGHDAIRAQIGNRGNFAIVPYAVRRKLMTHPRILNQIQVTNGIKQLTDQLLAQVFEVDRVYSPEGIYNTANPGQTVSMADIWGKDVIIGYNAGTPRLRTVTLGLLVRVNYGRFQAQTRTWTEQDRKADFVEASFTEARVLVAPQAAYLIKAAIA